MWVEILNMLGRETGLDLDPKQVGSRNWVRLEWCLGKERLLGKMGFCWCRDESQFSEKLRFVMLSLFDDIFERPKGLTYSQKTHWEKSDAHDL